MIKLGWVLTVYFCLSFILFFAASNTINGGIVYLFLLLPFYIIILIGWWFFVLLNRTKQARIDYRIWGLVLALQIATLLVSPGNCFGTKQGARCYSNVQILIENIPRTGPSEAPHWTLVEDSFFGFVVAYVVAVWRGLSLIEKSVERMPKPPDRE